MKVALRWRGKMTSSLTFLLVFVLIITPWLFDYADNKKKKTVDGEV